MDGTDLSAAADETQSGRVVVNATSLKQWKDGWTRTGMGWPNEAQGARGLPIETRGAGTTLNPSVDHFRPFP